MADAENQFMETSENGNEEDLNGAELAEEAVDEETEDRSTPARARKMPG